MSKSLVRNRGFEIATLPHPYNRVLKGGEGVIVGDTAANITAAIGSAQGLLDVLDLPATDPTANDLLSTGYFTAARMDSQFGTGAKPMSNQGVVPSARLKLATAPTALDTVVIDPHTFKFVAALAAQAAFTQVKIGTAAQSRARLVEAINGAVDASNVTPGTVAFPFVLADVIDTDHVRIRKADAQGGTVVTADRSAFSLVLSETLTAAADVWDRLNLNLTGKNESSFKMAMGSVAITAAMITAGKVYVEFPFAPTELLHVAATSTGATRSTDDLITVESNAAKITLAGGASPNLQAGDVVSLIAMA